MKLRLAFVLLAALTLVVAPAWGQNCYSVSGNLIANCGFETGNTSGWTFIPAGSGSDFYVGGGGYNRTYAAWFGAVSYQYDTLQQVLVTQPGASYDVSFWLAHDYTDSANSFYVAWDGNPIYSAPQYSFVYTEIETTVVGTGLDVITFNGYEVPAWFTLDNVVVATPEPGSLILLGSGVLGLAGLLRRKLNL